MTGHGKGCVCMACEAEAVMIVVSQVAVEAIIDERDALLDEARVIIETAWQQSNAWLERRRAWIERCQEVAK